MSDRFRAAAAAALIAFVVVTGCGSAKPVKTGESFVLGYGEEAGIDGVTIRFAEVVAESRCPRSVTCVWAGDAEIRLLVMKDDQRQSLLLHTSGSPEMPKAGSALGVELELIELQPYPETPERISSNRYRAELKVRHGEN